MSLPATPSASPVLTAGATWKGEMSFAGPAIVSTQIDGVVQARESLTLTRDAQVQGVVRARILHLQEGAQVRGRLEIRSAPTPSPVAASAAALLRTRFLSLLT